MSAAEGRTANRVQVPEGGQGQGDCACALCRELAACLPDVRELFRSHAKLFRENAELKIALANEQSDNRVLAEQSENMRKEIEYKTRKLGEYRNGLF